MLFAREKLNVQRHELRWMGRGAGGGRSSPMLAPVSGHRPESVTACLLRYALIEPRVTFGNLGT